MTLARAEIVVDLAAIRHNVTTLAERVAPALMMTVVKADGYGHGMVEVARAAREAGAPWLGVATPDEALALRAAGDVGRLLCWLSLPGEAVAPLLEADVDVTAYDVVELAAVVDAARATGRTARLQLKVDTGLHRGGSTVADWPALVAAARAAEVDGLVRVTGVWSHFAAAEDPDHPANDAQEQVFRAALAAAEEAGLAPEVRHLANSAAALLRSSARFDLVRCGIASYGIDPAPDVPDGPDATPEGPKPGLVPAMTVQAPLVLVKALAPGDGVSYGHTWTADRATTVGLVPLGYGDGVPRHAAAGVGSDAAAEVLVDGRRRPVRGRVCMDQLMVDLDGDTPPAGTAAVLFGPGGQGEPTALDWARACGTIDYEIVTRVGARPRRRYVDGAAPVASVVASGATTGATSASTVGGPA